MGILRRKIWRFLGWLRGGFGEVVACPGRRGPRMMIARCDCLRTPLPPPRSHRQHRASWRPSAEDGGRVGAKGIQGDRSPCPVPHLPLPVLRHYPNPASPGRGLVAGQHGKDKRGGGWVWGVMVFPPIPLRRSLRWHIKMLIATATQRGIRGDCCLRFALADPTPSGPTQHFGTRKTEWERESAENAC